MLSDSRSGESSGNKGLGDLAMHCKLSVSTLNALVHNVCCVMALAGVNWPYDNAILNLLLLLQVCSGSERGHIHGKP